MLLLFRRANVASDLQGIAGYRTFKGDEIGWYCASFLVSNGVSLLCYSRSVIGWSAGSSRAEAKA
jgi:hypothetical protein